MMAEVGAFGGPNFSAKIDHRHLELATVASARGLAPCYTRALQAQSQPTLMSFLLAADALAKLAELVNVRERHDMHYVAAPV